IDYLVESDFKIYGLNESHIRPWTSDGPYDPKSYSIIACTIFRLWNLHKLMEMVDNKHKTVKLMIQLVIDTHIDLMCVIWRTGIILDSVLLDPIENMESITRSIFESCYPHNYRYMYSGNFIDLSNAIDMGNL